MHTRPWLLATVAMAAFAANSLLCRAALGTGLVDAVSFTTLRLVSGALMLWAVTGWAGAGGPGSERQESAGLQDAATRTAGLKPHATVASALALFGYAITFSLAYLRIEAGVGALLLFGAVQLTLLGWGVAHGVRPRPGEWLGCAIAFAGLVVLARPGGTAPDLAGSVLMVVAGASWGFYTIHGRRATRPLAANARAFALSVPLSAGASAVALATGDVRVAGGGALLALVSGAITSGLGYAVWYAALRGLSVTQAAVIQLSVPPLAAAGAVMLLGESVTGRLLVSSTLVLGGIALAVGVGRVRTGSQG